MADNEELTKNIGQSLPYVMATGRIKATLEQIVKATVPERFTQDFLSTKLGIKGGSGRVMPPFLKKIGFINSDGTPTNIYKDFRIDSTRGSAMAKAISDGYSVLKEMNEYFYELNDKELRDLVVRATGSKQESSTVTAVVNSLKVLKEYAVFDEETIEATKKDVFKKQVDDSTLGDDNQKPDMRKPKDEATGTRLLDDIKLGYTININLPATSDISVYNAIFKSLRDNILDE